MDNCSQKLSAKFTETQELPALTPGEVQSQHEFVLRTFGDKSLNSEFAQARLWYAKYLAIKVRINWRLLSQSLRGLDNSPHTPRPGDLMIVYGFLATVGGLLKNRANLALVEVVDELDNKNALQEQMDPERAIQNQLVFAAIGWLSMLYDTPPNPSSAKLEITGLNDNSSDVVVTKEGIEYNTIQRGFDYIDQPMHVLLRKFGPLIPGTNRFSYLEKDLIAFPARETIDTRLLNLNSVLKSNQLKIEWVSSLGSHLQLDDKTGVLRIFKFPSICQLMLADQEHPLLTRLFKDHCERSCQDISQSEICSNKYFREMLSTYQLIFPEGVSNSTADLVRYNCAHSGDPEDPLLSALLSLDTTAVKLHPSCQGPVTGEEAEFFRPHASFPFFGTRLLELQQFFRTCVIQSQSRGIDRLRNATVNGKGSQGMLIVVFILLLVIWISKGAM